MNEKEIFEMRGVRGNSGAGATRWVKVYEGDNGTVRFITGNDAEIILTLDAAERLVTVLGDIISRIRQKVAP